MLPRFAFPPLHHDTPAMKKEKNCEQLRAAELPFHHGQPRQEHHIIPFT
jgi:hypothetical protein